MALFVDGPACTIEDLADQDSGLLDISANNAINVSTKIRLAHEEVRSDLHLWLTRPRPTVDMLWGPVLRIGQIVVTPSLKRWETMHALALVYRDAYFSQFVDRYQPKWREYEQLAREARDTFIADGVGLVADPVSQSVPPVLGSVSAPQSGGTFYVSTAWVNARGQEGAASAASSITIPDGKVTTVMAISPPVNAAGFRVYAGTSLTTMFLQNQVLLPVGTTYTYIPGQTAQGAVPGTGQKPDFVRPLARTLLRG